MPVPGLKRRVVGIISGIGEIKAKSMGVLGEPLIFRQDFEFFWVVLAVDPFLVDEIDGLSIGVAVFTITRQGDVAVRLPDGILVLRQIEHK